MKKVSLKISDLKQICCPQQSNFDDCIKELLIHKHGFDETKKIHREKDYESMTLKFWQE